MSKLPKCKFPDLKCSFQLDGRCRAVGKARRNCARSLGLIRQVQLRDAKKKSGT